MINYLLFFKNKAKVESYVAFSEGSENPRKIKKHADALPSYLSP